MTRSTFLSLGVAFLSPALASSAFAVPVTLQEATATFHQGNFGNVDQTIDGNTAAGGMAFFNNRTGNTTLVWESAADVAAGQLLTFTINQNFGQGHTLQKFRLSTTDANRALYADGLPPNGVESPAGDVDPTPGSFTVLSPLKVITTNGSNATIDGAGFVTITGVNPAAQTYTIQVVNPVASATGFRLEVVPGADGFVGRSAGAPHGSNGNAVLTEFSVDRSVAPAFLPVGLTNATATFSQNFNAATGAVNLAVDTLGNTGWSIHRGVDGSTPETAVFETQYDVGGSAGSNLTVQLDFTSGFAQHVLGRFRLSATNDDRSTFADGLLTGGDVTANWSVLDDITSIAAVNGSTITLLGDGSFLLSGVNPSQESLTIVLHAHVLGITGLRLEALADPSFPTSGPGRSANGNFVLTNFVVSAEALAVPEPASLSLLGLGALALLRRRRA